LLNRNTLYSKKNNFPSISQKKFTKYGKTSPPKNQKKKKKTHQVKLKVKLFVGAPSKIGSTPKF
jgi:hypothetical protein